MRKIINLIKKDILNMLRDNMIIYILISPAIFILMINIFLPSIENPVLTFAVNGRSQLIEYLSDYGNILEFENDEQIKKRVLQRDNVIGIIEKENSIECIFEGNENKKYFEITSIIISQIKKSSNVKFQISYINEKASFLRDYIIAIIMTMLMIFGGFITGFLYVEEREYSIDKVLAIAPISLKHIIVSRAILSFVITVFISIITIIFIYGNGIPYNRILLGCICGSLINVIIGYCMGMLANNQIKALTVTKVFNMLYLTIPIASIFINKKFHFIFYILPNFWAYHMYMNIFVESKAVYSYSLSLIMMLFTSIFLLSRMIVKVKKNEF